MKLKALILANIMVMTNLFAIEPEVDFTTLFDQERVNEIYITMDSQEWLKMQKNLKENIESNERFLPKTDENEGQDGENQGPDQKGKDGGDRPSMGGGGQEGGDRPPMDGGGPGGSGMQREVEYTYNLESYTADLTYNNQKFSGVSITYLEDISTLCALQDETVKLPFIINFETIDKGFYGYKELILDNNYNDDSFMREKVASEIYRDFGIPAPKTSFTIVVIDYGKGNKYFGLYTVVENFTPGTGNIYKPQGMAASFKAGSYNEGDIVKINNLEESDYSDVKMLYDAINSSSRIINLPYWKSNLESIFNVDGFLRWLAANAVMQNWDSYGNMTGNYYLYNDPATGLLNYIPWSNKTALNETTTNEYNLSFSRVSIDWPLIKYLLNVPEYRKQYEGYMKAFTYGVFSPENIKKSYNKYYNILEEYADYVSNDSFQDEVKTLIEHASDRHNAVDIYLN